MTSVLFVCLGNICRSPTAEGVFREFVRAEGLIDEIAIDSAGTGAWHVGEPPDQRAQAAAASRGYDLSAQRARQVTKADFERHDLILAMDRANLDDLHAICPTPRQDRIHLFLTFAQNADVEEVPDPYYGAGDGFQHVLDLVEDASRGLLAHLRAR
ncbi:MAG: low molecular weight protein-tyrosine-phosphatase [Pseudomonadota bacterium]